ncbi:MlaE family ABC transporter permease [Piscinibacter sp.]|uniref:MlaE family ABC transporter permease n=1 Tax=Piscinibacter sp. TaxID=1903157 RepID=UPI002F42C6FB
MPPLSPPRSDPSQWARAVRQWWGGWWQVIHFGAQVMVLALSPSSYRRAPRQAMVRSIYRATMPLLRSFTVISALIALVIIRIVLATAISYGLSRYALDVLVRTLVLELIPLSAALFVAVRYSLAAGDTVRALRARGPAGEDLVRDAVLPRVMAGVFAVVTLATVSSAVTLALTYLSVYGFSTWGLAGFTRAVGQVFNPVITLIFVLKTLCFSLAVTVVPMVTTPREIAAGATLANADLTRLARLLAVILLVEVGSLVGNYY